LHVDLDEADFLAVFPLAGQGRARLVGTVRGERAERVDTLRFDDVKNRAIANLKVKVERTNWFSTYHVHHRVAERFRNGRAFLLSDAAHIHSPAGGQGMNTGIGDAINLAWKLKTALDGRGPDALLDSYENERIAFARRLVKTTDQAFTIATVQGGFADLIRLWIAPVVIPAALSFEALREWAFRTVSQVGVNFRHSTLSEGKAGEVHGGDRLPWAVWTTTKRWPNRSGRRNASPELSYWSTERRLPLHVFSWAAEYARAGLMENAVYLIRPDTYVGLADPTGPPSAIERYLAARGLSS
jgi:hypothetical protein